MSQALRIAFEEWRLMRRDHVAIAGLLLLTVLTLMASWTAYEHHRSVNAQRATYQERANQEFAAQPDRHPHRMAHFGHFLFRPLNPLAIFDPGIDSYTGYTLYLEPHRQNGANLGDVRQSSLLLRFGQLSPAFVLQTLAPLLLIFIGHGVVARERENGTLRVLLAQGVGRAQLVGGKLLALIGVAGVVLLPACIALVGVSLNEPASPLPGILMASGYACWLLLWGAMIVWVSSLLARSRDALLVLLGIWAALVILFPRLSPDVANAAVSLPTRIESDIAVERDLAATGDSHNPDDPYFSTFRDKVLQQYGVQTVEELPVNYKGLLMAEGERITSTLYDQHVAISFDTQFAQTRIVDSFGSLSPLLALRRLSMSVAGTDLVGFRRFVEQGERYRYNLVQQLNRLQTEELRYADDMDSDKENRIEHAHWQRFPSFTYEAEPLSDILVHSMPAILTLTAWLGVLLAFSAIAARRLGRMTR